MNMMTQTEVHPTHTAAALEVADPTKNLILVPLSQLRPSKRNVRKTHCRLSIPELAASIQRVGLLQNLIVSQSEDGEHYNVEAGDRRLAALKLLAKKKRIAADHDVPCLLVADGSARTVSLTENVQREAMHPADQFEAFAALVAEGRPIEDIAADFSVTPLVVQRRLKLANVSPRLMADYRAGAVTLEQLMALAITDDHAAQEAAFYSAPQWQRSPSALREHLTEREIDAQHPLARFVGMDAYTEAGGCTRRDLFAEDDSGVYLDDAALLERMVREKLATLAEDVRAEGWAWVEAVPHLSHADRQAFQNAPRQRREPTAREARRIVSLQNRLDKIDTELEEAYDAEDEDKAETLEPLREQVAGELQAAEDALQGYAPDVRAVAGAIVTIDRNGEAAIHRGLLREAEAKALRTLEKLRQGFTGTEGANDDAGEDAEPPKAANLSDRLAQRLSAHRTAALQIEVARHPQVALAALAHGLVQRVLQDGYAVELPIGISVRPQDRLDTYAPDWPESPAAVALRELQQASGDGGPARGCRRRAGGAGGDEDGTQHPRTAGRHHQGLVLPGRRTGQRRRRTGRTGGRRVSLPSFVRLVEVGPRDGLQNEAQPISIDDKVRLVDALSAAGLRHIEVGSFVSPKWVPQMAGSAEVFARMAPHPGVVYAALTPNLKGFEDALQAGAGEVAVFAAASEAFSQRNINCSIADSLERFAPVMAAARQHGIRVRGYVSCVLGCPYEGEVAPAQVAAVARDLLAMGCHEISLGDTIGVGTPGKTRTLIETVGRDVPRDRLAGHFHDTYGQALANLYASLLEGVAVFDSSVAGLGGCPYARGASGNVASEDVIYLLHGLGIDTGIDLDRLIDAGRQISQRLGRPSGAKVARARADADT